MADVEVTEEDDGWLEEQGYRPTLEEVTDATRVVDLALRTLTRETCGMFAGQGERLGLFVWDDRSGNSLLPADIVGAILHAADIINCAIAAYPGFAWFWDEEGFSVAFEPYKANAIRRAREKELAADDDEAAA